MAQKNSDNPSHPEYVISDSVFNEIFKKFVNRYNFDSFYCGKVEEQEGYKRKICVDALKLLQAHEWKESDIGTGKIIQSVKRAVDIKENNLVRWNMKKPDSDTADNSLNNKIFSNQDRSTEFEKVIFEFFTNKIEDGIAFDKIRDLVGFYNYVAYIFFIKNPRKYLPISPENFDSFFKKIGINFKTDRKCSWTNYQQFLDIIHQFQNKLKDKGISDVSLLDAHTFCWMMSDIVKIEEKKYCSTQITPYNIYSRKELKDLFSITDSSINNGVYPVKGYSSILLFVTEKGDSKNNKYDDYFDGDILYFDGQTEGRTDKDLINHAKDIKEILVFYRKNKNQYPDFGFQYLGKFEYISHSGSHPTKFQFGIISNISKSDKSSIEELNDPDFWEPNTATEGKKTEKTIRLRERSRRLRIKALQYHGTTCKACGIDYSKIYGDMKERIIEVHHIIPLHHHEGETIINPYTDLIPLCANCHTLIHKLSNGAMPIEEFKQIIIAAQSEPRDTI